MTRQEKLQLQLLACKVREGVLISTHSAQSGHPGGSLSSADILTYLYFMEMHINPQNPMEPNRDRFVLSKGHCAPAYYSALALRGYFPYEDLKTLRHPKSYLQGHPNMNLVPGVDMSTGSLGQGVSTAVGMAKGIKLLKNSNCVYTLLGDGEMEEGQVWEACMFAAHYKLDNLCLFVDVNGLQIDGKTSEVMNSAPIEEKLKSFGFDVVIINGHDFYEIDKAVAKFHSNKGTGIPSAIILNTIKGKGISYMENQVKWHGKAPNDNEFETAMVELEGLRKGLEASINGQ